MSLLPAPGTAERCSGEGCSRTGGGGRSDPGALRGLASALTCAFGTLGLGLGSGPAWSCAVPEIWEVALNLCALSKPPPPQPRAAGRWPGAPPVRGFGLFEVGKSTSHFYCKGSFIVIIV